MPVDIPKVPGKYPFLYHDRLRDAWMNEGDWFVLETFNSKVEAQHTQRDFRAFIKALRMYPHQHATLVQNRRVETALVHVHGQSKLRIRVTRARPAVSLLASKVLAGNS